MPWGVFFFWYPTITRDGFESDDSTVQYTVAIRQAPHPLLSFCAVMAQIRLLLACDLNSFVLSTTSRASTFKLNVLAQGTGLIVSISRRQVKNGGRYGCVFLCFAGGRERTRTLQHSFFQRKDKNGCTCYHNGRDQEYNMKTICEGVRYDF